MAIEVGDWVRHLGDPMKVERVLGVMLWASTLGGVSLDVFAKECELWVPRVGEWVRHRVGSNPIRLQREVRRAWVGAEVGGREWLIESVDMVPCAAPEAAASPEPPKPDVLALLEAYERAIDAAVAAEENVRRDVRTRDAAVSAQHVARAALVAAMDGRP